MSQGHLLGPLLGHDGVGGCHDGPVSKSCCLWDLNASKKLQKDPKFFGCSK